MTKSSRHPYYFTISFSLLIAAGLWGLFWIPQRALEAGGLTGGWATISQMVYPEVAVFKFPNYDRSNVISPQDFLNEAKKWKSLGAQIIGGCCGTSVEHIKVLQDL